ncbi:hypothetical protein BgiBS90_022973, partial [Biomphalaria glabrata]
AHTNVVAFGEDEEVLVNPILLNFLISERSNPDWCAWLTRFEGITTGRYRIILLNLKMIITLSRQMT